MLHQDSRTNSVCLGKALQWLFEGVHFHRTPRTGCSWTFCWLAQTALLWAWSNERKMTERFECAQRLTLHLLGNSAQAPISWQAYIDSLRRHTAYLRQVLIAALRKRMLEELREQSMIAGFVILGVDGSDIAVPLTKSNEAAFSAKKKPGKRCRRKKAQANKSPKRTGADKRSGSPQILLTTLYLVGIHLPWNWSFSGRNTSERGLLRTMLNDLPEQSLIAGDAGFVGYDLAASIIAHGAQMVIRVGSNVRLLKKLGSYREKGGIVFLWPEKAAIAKRPPLKFRLVTIYTEKHPIYLIVSVLDDKQLTDAQVAEIYQKRWRIEIFHRHLKQTFARTKLLSRSSANAAIELEWSMLSLWAMCLYASVEIHRHKIPLERLSFSGVLDAFRTMARDYLHPTDPFRTLPILIRQALLDTYERKSSKASRDYPRRKKHKPPGKPEIIKATPDMRKQAKPLLQ